MCYNCIICDDALWIGASHITCHALQYSISQTFINIYDKLSASYLRRISFRLQVPFQEWATPNSLISTAIAALSVVYSLKQGTEHIESNHWRAGTSYSLSI